MKPNVLFRDYLRETNGGTYTFFCRSIARVHRSLRHQLFSMELRACTLWIIVAFGFDRVDSLTYNNCYFVLRSNMQALFYGHLMCNRLLDGCYISVCPLGVLSRVFDDRVWMILDVLLVSLFFFQLLDLP